MGTKLDRATEEEVQLFETDDVDEQGEYYAPHNYFAKLKSKLDKLQKIENSEHNPFRNICLRC